MQEAYHLVGDVIIINRDLTALDFFVRDFLNVLKRHSDYLLVSGYVSITTGRTRGTEDIDVLIEAMSKEKFRTLFNDLEKNGFWCYQGDTADAVYPYIKERISLRFARNSEHIPNMELIPIDWTKKAKFYEYTHPQKMRVQDFEFNVAPLEFEILYKELILKSDKDISDAKHLRTVFSEILDEDRFKACRKVIEND